MTFNLNNPWLITIIGGALGAIIAGIILYYLFRKNPKKEVRAIIVVVKSENTYIYKSILEGGDDGNDEQ